MRNTDLHGHRTPELREEGRFRSVNRYIPVDIILYRYDIIRAVQVGLQVHIITQVLYLVRTEKMRTLFFAQLASFSAVKTEPLNLLMGKIALSRSLGHHNHHQQFPHKYDPSKKEK